MRVLSGTALADELVVSVQQVDPMELQFRFEN